MLNLIRNFIKAYKEAWLEEKVIFIALCIFFIVIVVLETRF
jgi:uncharacterized membrane protein YesL